MSTLTAPEPRTRQAAGPRSDAHRLRRLGQYATPDRGQTREIVSLRRPEGSTLVIDRLAGALDDVRLVAQLAPEEPVENADIVAGMYLADESRGRCRPVTAADLDVAPAPEAPHGCTVRELRDADGTVYRIQALALDGRFPELRWTRSILPDQAERFETVRLRDVVARFEDYEPARSISANALAAHPTDPTLSTCCLTAELMRLAESPVVLNRRLREAVAHSLADAELSMSEIAMRCGRVKRDRRGRLSGETSWLARRIGQLPEGGEDQPTPWVHSDTLALIAREGLGMSPSEVEL